MADIYNAPDHRTLVEDLRAMEDSQLLAQNFVQQGAIHAVSFLLKYGCNEETATEMLASLRENAGLVRTEAARRGKPELFTEDQTVFD